MQLLLIFYTRELFILSVIKDQNKIGRRKERARKRWKNFDERREKVKAGASFCSVSAREYSRDPSIFQAGGFDRGPPTNRI